MTVPALRELRRLLPNAHIAIVSKPGTAEIFVDADFADEILVYDRSGLASAWNQAKEWRQRNFDLALLLQNAFEAAAIAFLARIPIRVGYNTDRRGFLLTNSIPLPAWKSERHEIFYYLNIVRELERMLTGAAARDDAPAFELSVSTERKAAARQLLQANGAGSPIVLLCPGSVNSRAKRWPAERFAALGDRFIDTGAAVVLIGSAGELEVTNQVRTGMRGQPIVFTGKTTVAEATALIRVADILITNDTGPAHIGSAVGTPTLAIFGPTNPITTRPFGPNGDIIRHPPDCAPCMLRDCPIDHRCLTAISPEEVFARAMEMLGQGKSQAPK